MAKAKSKKIGKIILKILLGLAAFIAAVLIISAILNAIVYSGLDKYVDEVQPVKYDNQLQPELDEETGYYTFHTDKDFKVLQITDVHIGSGFLSYSKDKMAINAVVRMVSVEKPDLVIVSGDVSFPVLQSGTFNNLHSARLFAKIMDKMGVYWALCYGNHDTELISFATREKLSEKIYESGDYAYCLFQSGPEEVDGVGNYAINVKNSRGIITRTFYLLDTHSYVDGDFLGAKWLYDNVHDNQCAWYSSQVKLMNDINKRAIEGLDISDKEKAELTEIYGVAKSFAFFHIPIGEYLEAYNEYADNGFKDTDNVTYYYGAAGEDGKIVCCGVHEDNFFETIKAEGSTQGTFCGHDHLNCFSFDYKGVRLSYGYSIDYLAYSNIYKVGSQRGCTVIISHTDSTWESYLENYYQDKYASDSREKVEMQVLNENME